MAKPTQNVQTNFQATWGGIMVVVVMVHVGVRMACHLCHACVVRGVRMLYALQGMSSVR